jgi:anthranilate/para-aminobenzoate synthase component II
MAIEHKEKPIYGVQFHPESINTNNGKKLIKNFLRLK